MKTTLVILSGLASALSLGGVTPVGTWSGTLQFKESEIRKSAAQRTTSKEQIDSMVKMLKESKLNFRIVKSGTFTAQIVQGKNKAVTSGTWRLKGDAYEFTSMTRNGKELPITSRRAQFFVLSKDGKTLTGKSQGQVAVYWLLKKVS